MKKKKNKKFKKKLKKKKKKKKKKPNVTNGKQEFSATSISTVSRTPYYSTALYY